MYGLHSDIVPASVVTLGMFDGVHRGHQALLAACRRHADRLGLPAVALTYEPHPARVLRPDAGVRLLTPLPEKIERLGQYGMDLVAVGEFTHAFSQLTPEQFLRDALDASFHPRVVVAGYRTTFGHARAGTATVLREFGGELGFEVDIVEPIEVAGAPVSSTRVRDCLDNGDVRTAAELLGYRYRMTGTVMVGDGRGRQLGVPTANLDVHPDKLVPGDGIYAVEACLPGAGHRRGVMHIGARPVFSRPRALEVHLLDFNGDIYLQPLTVVFLARLREIRNFPDANALIAQMREDIAQARALDVSSPQTT
ncbi:MAG: bifunctional riboflavin kinase/FAD synthetase [Armatimonadota bacterium]